jgi:hypothetical protein
MGVTRKEKRKKASILKRTQRQVPSSSPRKEQKKERKLHPVRPSKPYPFRSFNIYRAEAKPSRHSHKRASNDNSYAPRHVAHSKGTVVTQFLKRTRKRCHTSHLRPRSRKVRVLAQKRSSHQSPSPHRQSPSFTPPIPAPPRREHLRDFDTRHFPREAAGSTAPAAIAVGARCR